MKEEKEAEARHVDGFRDALEISGKQRKGEKVRCLDRSGRDGRGGGGYCAERRSAT